MEAEEVAEQRALIDLNIRDRLGLAGGAKLTPAARSRVTQLSFSYELSDVGVILLADHDTGLECLTHLYLNNSMVTDKGMTVIAAKETRV
jgi:hypothetical protein